MGYWSVRKRKRSFASFFRSWFPSQAHFCVFMMGCEVPRVDQSLKAKHARVFLKTAFFFGRCSFFFPPKRKPTAYSKEPDLFWPDRDIWSSGRSDASFGKAKSVETTLPSSRERKACLEGSSQERKELRSYPIDRSSG